MKHETLNMSTAKKIFIVILVVIVVGAIVGFVLLKHWARPDRLGDDDCLRLVRSSMEQAYTGSPTGSRVLEYRLDGRIVRERLMLTAPINYMVSQHFHDRLFESEDEFFANIKLRHMGRLRIAGRVCERVRLSPIGYDGDSIELWIEPATGYLLGHRRFDSGGQFIRGYRFRSVSGFTDAEEVASEDLQIGEAFPGMGPLDGQGLIEPEVIRGHVERNELALPEFTPSGFELVGARIMEAQRPGMRDGQGPGPMQGPPVAQSCTIYSDGLNTISVIQIPIHDMIDTPLDPGRVEEVLGFKAKEMQRIFHTSMAWKRLPNCIILLYGEVSQELLMEVAASIPDGMVMPIHQMRPPDDAGIFPPVFERPPGFERPERPFGPGLGPRNRPGDSE